MIRNLSSSPIVLQDIGSPRSYIISQHASQVYLPDKALTDSLQRATMIVDITAAAYVITARNRPETDTPSVQVVLLFSSNLRL